MREPYRDRTEDVLRDRGTFSPGCRLHRWLLLFLGI
jgi:hypothetical protein